LSRVGCGSKAPLTERPLLADSVEKTFLADQRIFLGPLMRFVRGHWRFIKITKGGSTWLVAAAMWKDRSWCQNPKISPKPSR
jgi:hypothetical protein